MPYDFSWYIDKVLLRQHFYGTIDVPEIRASIVEGLDMVRREPTTVHAIVDLLDVTDHPKRLQDMLDLLKDGVPLAPNMGWTVFVSKSPLLRFLGTTLLQLTKQRVSAVLTVDDAFIFLSKRDARVPPKKP